MTPDEQELLEKYLAHRNVIGDEGEYPDFESWYQAVRYAQGPGSPSHPGRGVRTALQGHPRRRPDLQPAAGEPRTCVTTVGANTAPRTERARGPRTRSPGASRYYSQRDGAWQLTEPPP